MKHRNFGRTGISVSSLGLGTATLGKQADEAASFAILDKATEAGMNFIYSSDFYPMNASPDEMGRSEEILGRWLKGKLGRFIIGTKAGAPVGSSNWDRGASRKHLLDAIDGSLRRLPVFDILSSWPRQQSYCVTITEYAHLAPSQSAGLQSRG